MFDSTRRKIWNWNCSGFLSWQCLLSSSYTVGHRSYRGWFPAVTMGNCFNTEGLFCSFLVFYDTFLNFRCRRIFMQHVLCWCYRATCKIIDLARNRCGTGHCLSYSLCLFTFKRHHLNLYFFFLLLSFFFACGLYLTH
jgi:hypothetical protein